MARTIKSPGVEIRERDLSLVASLPVGTNVFVQGYAAQGPSDELVNVTSSSELEQIYGVPTNAAERYFYHTARQVLNSPGNLLVNRLPYGGGEGEGYADYTALLYPVCGLSAESDISGSYEFTANSKLVYHTIDYSTVISVHEGSFNVSVSDYNLKDDAYGPGVLSSANDPLSGTIDYATGDISLDFTHVPYLSSESITIDFDYDGYVNTSYTQAERYEILEPKLMPLTQKQYMNVQSGMVKWAEEYKGEIEFDIDDDGIVDEDNLDGTIYEEMGKAGIVILNKAKKSVNEHYEGYYVAITDNSVIGDDYYDSIKSIQYKHPKLWDWRRVSETTLEFDLTGDIDSAGVSMSEVLESVPTFDAFSGDAYKDSIVVQIYKVRTTLYGSQVINTLDMVPSESYLGSLDSHRKWAPSDGGEESFFISNHVNNESNIIDLYVNRNIASEGGSWSAGSEDGFPQRAVRMDDDARNSYAFGRTVFSSEIADKVIGNVPLKLQRSLRLAENRDLVPIDIVLDGGLSTIWTNVRAEGVDDLPADRFDDTIYLENVQEGETNYLGKQGTGQSTDICNDWETIFDRLNGFCAETRRDCLLIVDPLRNIFVQGADQKVLDDPTKNFSQHVYWPLKNLIAATNSNYACTYANWVKAYDNELGDFAWLPFSGFEANIMCNLDANLQPWFAAAGLNNGIIRGIVDISMNPNQRQRDLLYKINANPIVFFPGDGYTVWGQKTLQKKPSAFDRINVRRLFIVLQKATLAIMRYFVFEPNTVFTRTRVVNVLTPIFDIAKNNEGLYDYLIVCDERNNTPQVIDNNELVVDIYLKPVRIAEFILCNFIATRTDQDFTELL